MTITMTAFEAGALMTVLCAWRDGKAGLLRNVTEYRPDDDGEPLETTVAEELIDRLGHAVEDLPQ